MKKWLFETVILLIQLILFYMFPLTSGATDVMGMIVIMVIVTFLLSTLLAIVSDKRIRFLYPLIVSIAFIPSVFLYYNDSALIHAGWYFVVSMVGMLIGTLVHVLRAGW